MRLYAMNGAECVKWHTFKTREELITLLRTYFEAGNAVVASEINWHVEPNPRLVLEATLKRTGEMLTGRHAGLHKLVLEIGSESFFVCSGQAYAQSFRRPQDPRSRPGNMEPIPQGVYKFSSTVPIFAGAMHNYDTSHGAGLGPIWDGLSATFSDDRGAFGVHLDAGAIGTAGCVGLLSIADCKRYVDVRRANSQITQLNVDWGL